jgi:hypothetical protein
MLICPAFNIPAYSATFDDVIEYLTCPSATAADEDITIADTKVISKFFKFNLFILFLFLS